MTDLPPGFVLDAGGPPPLPPGFELDKPSIAADVAKSIGAGAAKGVIGLAGMSGDLADLGGMGVDWAAKKLGTPEQFAAYQAANEGRSNPLPTSHDLQSRIEGVTGKFYEPKTIGGEYAQTAGEFLPALIGGPESLGAKLITRVAAPALASETAGQLTKGTAAEPWARLAGGVAGGLAGPAILEAGRRIVTPLPATAVHNDLANTLRAEGVDLTAGQATGSRPMQWLESTLGDLPGAGARVAEVQARQGEQFTAAALRRAGETADRATPQVIDNAFNRIGGQFDTLAARNNMGADRQLGADLATAQREYENLVGPTQRAPVIQNTMNDIHDTVAQNGGHLTGEQFNALSSRLRRQATAAAADPQLSGALRDTREAIHDAMERSINRSGNMGDLAAWREARNQYRNLMVLERAATGPGVAAAEGIISPSQLRNATVAQNRRSYARGQGDFADLARAGEGVMKPLPNSGTGPRTYMQHALTAVGAVAGGAGAGAPGALAGLAAPGLAGRALMSRPVQAYLGNQRVVGNGQRLTAQQQALLAAMLAIQSRSGSLPAPQAAPPVMNFRQ